MDFWNTVGLVLTFIGTAITIYQAHKAKTYRDEIQTDRQKLILIELMPIAKNARDECKKIITPVDKPMRGVDNQIVISTIQGLSEKLQEFQHRLNEEQSIIDFTNNIKNFISEYTNQDDIQLRHKIADKILDELNLVIQHLASNIDKTI